jgi:hypothetical protein
MEVLDDERNKRAAHGGAGSSVDGIRLRSPATPSLSIGVSRGGGGGGRRSRSTRDELSRAQTDARSKLVFCVSCLSD